jgi:hypothetical protein
MVQGNANLLEIVAAVLPRRRLAHLSGGGNQQRNQDGDDCEHHHEFDPGKRMTSSHNASLNEMGAASRSTTIIAPIKWDGLKSALEMVSTPITARCRA